MNNPSLGEKTQHGVKARSRIHKKWNKREIGYHNKYSKTYLPLQGLPYRAWFTNASNRSSGIFRTRLTATLIIVFEFRGGNCLRSFIGLAIKAKSEQMSKRWCGLKHTFEQPVIHPALAIVALRHREYWGARRKPRGNPKALRPQVVVECRQIGSKQLENFEIMLEKHQNTNPLVEN